MKEVFVAGDLLEDVFLYGNCKRINPEGPFPLVTLESKTVKYGGAGNVWANLNSLGIPMFFTHANEKTITQKTRVVVGNSIVCRYDEDVYSTNFLTADELEKLDLTKYQYVVLSDYNKGYLRNVQEVIRKFNEYGCLVIVDPKQDFSVYKGAWCIKPNQKEFEKFYGPVTKENLKKFCATNNHKLVIVTMGDKGVVYYYEGVYKEIPATTDHVADVTGAGDCFLAAFVYGLMHRYSIEESIELGNRGAGISVQYLGTYTLNPSDIIQKTVFTNGCFDIIHRGHIELLEKSKDLGDRLVVGLNSDESIKRLKGVDRPIMNQEDRKKTLESLRFVNEVIIFNEDTPYNLIKEVKPDIITKGGDYKIDEVVGNDLTRVVIIPYVGGYSTTGILSDVIKAQ
jgi:D-beta-D-heptose 7-phosphate kinase/D-beta-D-heptose 1-phosphate adenosyltransferase